MIKRQRHIKASGRHVQHAQAFGDNFGTNAIAGNDCDSCIEASVATICVVGSAQV
jgi:hypothetical protein